MKVTYRQSGGFAGIVFVCELDTASLSEEEARTLRSLVHEGELEQVGRLDPVARDAIQYDITVQVDGEVTQVRFDDLALPQSVLPLVSYLRERAKPSAP